MLWKCERLLCTGCPRILVEWVVPTDISWSGKMLFKGPDLIEIFKPALHRQQNYLSHMYVWRPWNFAGYRFFFAEFRRHSKNAKYQIGAKERDSETFMWNFGFFFNELILSKFSGMSNEKCSKLCSFFDVGSTEGMLKECFAPLIKEVLSCTWFLVVSFMIYNKQRHRLPYLSYLLSFFSFFFSSSSFLFSPSPSLPTSPNQGLALEMIKTWFIIFFVFA